VGTNITFHDYIKGQIFKACNTLGLQTKEEYKGKDWRADVFAISNNIKYAFEVQIGMQSLNKTIKRQEKYLRDGVVGCWLFKDVPKNLIEERQDLPFFIINQEKEQTNISLKDRKNLPLDVFINDFLQNKIKFCKTAVAKPKQQIEIVFVKMDCWKCGKENHIYYIASDFSSACNSKITYEEAMWDSNRKEYRPEIQEYINNYLNTEKGKQLNIGKIKERFSKTVESSYTSFGCSKCDSIFGDWFVQEAIMEAWYGAGVVDKVNCEIEMELNLRLNIPHWCHPGDSPFCE
jgi:hypothetical protein